MMCFSPRLPKRVVLSCKIYFHYSKFNFALLKELFCFISTNLRLFPPTLYTLHQRILCQFVQVLKTEVLDLPSFPKIIWDKFHKITTLNVTKKKDFKAFNHIHDHQTKCPTVNSFFQVNSHDLLQFKTKVNNTALTK